MDEEDSGDELEDLLRKVADESRATAEQAAKVSATVSTALVSLVSVALQNTQTQATFSVNSGRGGRTSGARTVKRGECRYFADYLAPNAVYSPIKFRKVFRIPLSLYKSHFQNVLPQVDPMLGQLRNAAGTPGHSADQKILIFFRRIATGDSYMNLDDSVRMSVESQRQYFIRVARAIKEQYGARYLNRRPSEADFEMLDSLYDDIGLPGCIGSVDCMKIKWKNTPKELKGQFHNPKDGKLGVLTVEAWADHRLFCWHWNAGRPGTNNDITVIDHSPLLASACDGSLRLARDPYTLNGSNRSLRYFLGDGIYPEWAIFAKPIPGGGANEKEKLYTTLHEAVRKEVERFFGVIQGRFQFLRRERHEFELTDIVLVSEVCVIIHNMLVELSWIGQLNSEIGEDGQPILPSELIGEFMHFQEQPDETPTGELMEEPNWVENGQQPSNRQTRIHRLLNGLDQVMDPHQHRLLRKQLVEHIWTAHGTE